MFGKRNKPSFIKMEQLSSLVDEGVEISGDITFASGMRIDGRVFGNIVGRSHDGQRPALLVLSNKGRIEGSVRCGDAVVNGVVVGDLDVENFLELQSDAQVRGTIRYKRLQMDVGASVEGQLVRVDATAVADNVVELGAEKAAAVAERR